VDALPYLTITDDGFQTLMIPRVATKQQVALLAGYKRSFPFSSDFGEKI
jgi:2-keto-3-deoxy-L-rhamnonate aldolase RhmA